MKKFGMLGRNFDDAFPAYLDFSGCRDFRCRPRTAPTPMLTRRNHQQIEQPRRHGTLRIAENISTQDYLFAAAFATNRSDAK